MSAGAQPGLTPEQYLEIERAADSRSEYYRGRVYAMSGGTFEHSSLIIRLAAALSARLGTGPCSNVVTDLRLQVEHQGLYTYPDVMVVCGKPELLDSRRDTLRNPTLIFEVLSKSTERRDRGFKFHEYQRIATLKEYVLVSQWEPRLEVFRRQQDTQWLLTDYLGLEAVCRLDSVGIEIPLAELYRNVEFPGTGEV